MAALVGWGRDYGNEGFGDQGGVKHQIVSLITAVQTLLRGELLPLSACILFLFLSHCCSSTNGGECVSHIV